MNTSRRLWDQNSKISWQHIVTKIRWEILPASTWDAGDYKAWEDASRSKNAFSKSHGLWDRAYKKRIDQPGQMQWSKFSIKILGVTFGNSIL